MRGCGAAAVDVAVEVHREEAVPIVVGRLEEGLDDQPGGVVDPDVDAAEAFYGLLGEPLDVAGIARVAGEHERFATGFADGTLGLGRLLERHAGDVGARLRERDRDRLADAPRRAGDHGRAAAQVEPGGRCHVVAPVV